MVKGRGKTGGKGVVAPTRLVLKPGNKVTKGAGKPTLFKKAVVQPQAPKEEKEKVQRPKIEKGQDDDPECWEVAQLGHCPRFPCKWAPCVDKDVTDEIFKGATVSHKYCEENGIDAEELGLRVRQPREKGAKKAKGNGKAKGKGKDAQGQQAKKQKGKGKGGKAIKPKEKKEKKPLVGPNGETADDETCWEVKQTGLCPRFPCKWQPCADLPQDDPIFADAKVRKPKTAFKKQIAN